MAVPPREYVWKAPYKPPRASESDAPQAPTVSRRSSSLSPKSRPAPAQRPDTEFSFHFPRRSLLSHEVPTSQRLFLNCQSPITPNMSDPTTVNEVGPLNFPLEKLRGPGASSYSFLPFLTSAGSQTEKQKMIASLRNHSVNTLAELRRIERIFATMGTSDVTEPMTTAWQHYVNSHMLLTELRSLTRNYPFSSDCLDEAKRRVLIDPDSNRSWNYCWLVLSKISSDNLIPYYAHHQAAMPAMWGNQLPSPEGIQALSAAFVAEWGYALDQMLRHWETPPVGRDS